MIMEVSKTKAVDLIPGLPSELAIDCLIRVPYQFHYAMKSVCRSWKILLSDSSFIRERRRCGKAELLLCLVQPVKETLIEEGEIKPEIESQYQQQPRFGLSIYNATFITWHHVTFYEQKIPLFCECVVLQDVGKILLIGGWDPKTLQPVKDVYLLEFSGEGSGRRWLRGAPMKESRSFFACASVGSTKVYVAGGHDDQKNALRSAEVYDVEKNEWSRISSMTEERDECQGFAIGMDQGFCVLSGYATESQGRFRSDAEIYDPATNSWSKIENIWPFPNTNPRGHTAIDITSSSRLYCFTDGELQRKHRCETKDDSRKWKLDLETIELSITGSSVFAGSLGGEAMAMISGRKESEDKEVMMMMKTTEKKIGEGSQIQIPSGFSTVPFSQTSIYV